MSCVSPNKPLDRYTLINLFQKVGHTKKMSRTMIDHLTFLIKLTKDVDWQGGNKAIAYMSVTKTAQQLGISERQVHNRERELCEKLKLNVKVNGNFRRYGTRDAQTEIITHAFGIDITNLKTHVQELQKALYEVAAEQKQWNDLKLALSSLKGQIRKLINFAFGEKIEDCISGVLKQKRRYEGRISASTTIDELKCRIMHAEKFKKLLERAISLGKTREQNTEQPVKTSDQSEVHSRHIKPSIKTQTTNKLVGKKRAKEKDNAMLHMKASVTNCIIVNRQLFLNTTTHQPMIAKHREARQLKRTNHVKKQKI